jgi:hypothetical protein
MEYPQWEDEGIIYNVYPSKRKNKKYDVFKDNKYLLSFGDNRYEHYKDKIGHYKDLNHNDEKRKELYYKRHGKANKYSAKWFSHKFLW